jgi:16S rRNA (adenine1518-N6/adenine1519-N6)-dimethyltransferase
MLPSKVKDLCQNYGIKPTRSKGQNFLVDDNIIKKIMDSANLQAIDQVLEIGPGLGVLTEKLLEQAKQVIAVELDKQVIVYLRTNFKKQLVSEKMILVEQDALKVNFREVGLKDFEFKIVANLPYSITSKFFRLFLEYGPKPTEIIVMIQKEVAKRIIAKKGEMNLLALSAQFFGEPEILFEVSRSCFWPEPEIDSAVIRIKLKQQLPEVDYKLMFRLARMGFASKRKQLHNNLAGGLKRSSEEIKEVLKQLGFREDIRAQDLAVKDWIGLTQAVAEKV